MLHHFSEATAFLLRTRGVWSPRPFREKMEWPQKYPEVAQWCLSLEDDALESAEQDFWLYKKRFSKCEIPSVIDDWLVNVEKFTELPLFANVSQSVQKIGTLSTLSKGVKARKKKQIDSFLGAIDPALENDAEIRVLDWCAGKAHLSRSFAENCRLRKLKCDVLSFEVQRKLIEESIQTAQKEKFIFSAFAQDVLRPFSKKIKESAKFQERHLFALHACGGLFDKALDAEADLKLQSLHAVGCCYHKHHLEYIPRSSEGKRAGLVLNSGDLHLPATDESVAGDAQKEHRRRAMVYRAGLDELLKSIKGKVEYTATPAMPRKVFSFGFAEFVQKMNEKCSLELPEKLSSVLLDEVLLQGENRVKRSRRLGVVRGIFRRLLEVWIAADRALSLQEKGFTVELGLFCSSEITPRNVMIRAYRKDK